jgi:hypothetical protein
MNEPRPQEYKIPPVISVETFKNADQIKLAILNAYSAAIFSGIKDYSSLWCIVEASCELTIAKVRRGQN